MSPLELIETLGRCFALGVQSLLALPRALLRPNNWLQQFYHIFIGALPLGLVAGIALGAVVWMHLREPLKTVGGPHAVAILPQALALAVLLELAPIAAGLIVAGRTGASLSAELGSMKQTEQLDALEMLGVSPLRELIAPRVLATLLALPLVTVFIAFMAILSGYFAELLARRPFDFNPSWAAYQQQSLQLLDLHDVIPAILKTVVFGYLIAVVSCQAGLAAQGGTEGVGKAATRGVVGSIFAVLIADVFLVGLISVLRQFW